MRQVDNIRSTHGSIRRFTSVPDEEFRNAGRKTIDGTRMRSITCRACTPSDDHHAYKSSKGYLHRPAPYLSLAACARTVRPIGTDFGVRCLVRNLRRTFKHDETLVPCLQDWLRLCALKKGDVLGCSRLDVPLSRTTTRDCGKPTIGDTDAGTIRWY